MSPSENEGERFEDQLRSVAPARPPAAFLERLKSETPVLVAERRVQAAVAARPAPAEGTTATEADGVAASAAWSSWVGLIWRWLVPATAVLVIGVVLWRGSRPTVPVPQAARVPLKADNVQIDQQLVSTFDTVAPLPDGEPVRFRCREWMDEVVVRDTRRGVEVTRRVPRVEVVPVRFETY
jgi:hypothetical protein